MIRNKLQSSFSPHLALLHHHLQKHFQPQVVDGQHVGRGHVGAVHVKQNVAHAVHAGLVVVPRHVQHLEENVVVRRLHGPGHLLQVRLDRLANVAIQQVGKLVQHHVVRRAVQLLKRQRAGVLVVNLCQGAFQHAPRLLRPRRILLLRLGQRANGDLDLSRGDAREQRDATRASARLRKGEKNQPHRPRTTANHLLLLVLVRHSSEAPLSPSILRFSVFAARFQEKRIWRDGSSGGKADTTQRKDGVGTGTSRGKLV
jgi:hypothetical protein